jgi:hypothetical protein
MLLRPEAPPPGHGMKGGLLQFFGVEIWRSDVNKCRMRRLLLLSVADRGS